tara:strand:- start:163 stop:270 length:108 start_codon:yes stop_codon:yes gene_type:complete
MDRISLYYFIREKRAIENKGKLNKLISILKSQACN